MSEQKTEQKTLKPSDFAVGQKIIFVGNNHRGFSSEPKELVIHSVGRKWVSASIDGSHRSWCSYRFAPPCMQADGGEYMSPGEFVVSLEAYQADKQAAAQWRNLQDLVRGLARPKHMTAERIEALIEELKEAA